MYVIIETLVRPSLDVKFPSTNIDTELGKLLTEQAGLRAASAAWIGSAFEKNEDGLTATITQFWSTRTGKKEFYVANKDLTAKVAAARNDYLKENGITSTIISQVEKITVATAKARIATAKARSGNFEAARIAKLAKTS